MTWRVFKSYENFPSFNFGNTFAIHCKYPRVIYSEKFYLSVCTLKLMYTDWEGEFILHSQFYQEFSEIKIIQMKKICRLVASYGQCSIYSNILEIPVDLYYPISHRYHTLPNYGY